MDILDEEEIINWFDEVLHDLFNIVYQQYHLDVCYRFLILPHLKKTVSCSQYYALL